MKGTQVPTIEEVMTAHDVEVPTHLADQVEVRICHGAVRQGDVIFLPARAGKVANLKPIPAEGIAVVRGEAGGNTHLLVGGGQWAANTSDPAIQGTLVVASDSDPAYLLHPEHGCTAFGEGTFIGRRQQEQAEQIRLVAD